jgi:hypothetical protein
MYQPQQLFMQQTQDGETLPIMDPRFNTPAIKAHEVIQNLIMNSKSGFFSNTSIDKDSAMKAKELIIINFLDADAQMDMNDHEDKKFKGKIIKRKAGEYADKDVVKYEYVVYTYDMLRGMDLYDLWYALREKQKYVGMTSYFPKPDDRSYLGLMRKEHEVDI